MHRPSTFSGLCRVVLLTLFVASLLGSVALAQVTSGTIFGTVKDASGAVIPNAKVTAKADAIGASRTVTTNGTGDFVLPNLPPATYTLVTEAQGFKKLATSGVVLNVTDKLSVGVLTLQVGAADSEVTVAADAGQIQIQANSAERSDLISSKQLNDIALNGRMVLDYVKLVPGVISTFDGHQSGTGGMSAFSINGSRTNQHEFTIDGASNMDTGDNGGTHVTVNPDAIAEVKVLTSNYQAEFGKAAGGQVVLTTKGGTNEFHGNVRFFHRHEQFNANDYISNENGSPLGKYRYNYVGYQIGGPVIVPGTDLNKNHDKLFFFWSQEYYRQKLPVGGGSTTFYVPTELERQGDFSQSVDGNGKKINVYSPYIVNNVIQQNLLNPTQLAIFKQVQAYFSLFPKPNVSGYGDGKNYNYITSISPDNPRREDILRLDYQIGSKNRFFGRWINNADTTSGPVLPWPGYGTFACTGAINIEGGCTSKHPGWNLSLNLVSTLTPTLLNEFSIGPSVSRTDSQGDSGNLSIAKNGISLPSLFPISNDQSIPDFGFNGIDNTNFGWSYLGATPWFQSNTTINVNDNITWVKKAHTFKFGLFYQRSRKDQAAWGNVNGQYSWDKAATAGVSCPVGQSCGDPYASALLGIFSNYSQSTARPRGYFRYNQLEFYAQDTWKLAPRLTLDYGMRFAWIPPQYDAKNQVSIFDPNAYDPASAPTVNPDGTVAWQSGQDRFDGMVFTSNHTVPTGGWDSRGIMAEPRVGLAYDLFGDHKTVLRAGFGLMHDRTQGNLIFNNVFNNPALVETGSVSNPAAFPYTVSDLPSLGSDLGTGREIAQAMSGTLNVFGAARDGKVPTVQSYSLGIQRDLGKGTTLDVSYVGSHSFHLVTARDINAIPNGTAFQASSQNPSCSAFGGSVPAVEPNLPPEYAAAGYSFSGKCSYAQSYLRPYKGYGRIEYLEFNGTSNYNSLQVSLQRRYSHGLTFGAVYTWSRALTAAGADEEFVDTYYPKLYYRSASWDRTHVAAFNYVYDIPGLAKHFGGGKLAQLLLDGFQFSGVTQFMSGTPIDTPIWTDPWALTGGGSDTWWDKVPLPAYVTVDGNGNLVMPTIGKLGRGSRDTFRTGGMQNWDMSLFKNFKFNEQRYIQLRAEAFNVFNHTNWSGKDYGVSFTAPSYDSGTGTYAPMSITKDAKWGQHNSLYTGTGGPRVLQLAAKVYF